jgi:drug/metabolite transporter (DMT)-like permease
MSIPVEMHTFNLSKRRWLPGLVTSLLFLVVCLSWGTTWLGIKIAVESAPPLTSAGLRFLIAFPLFLTFAWVRGESVFFPKGSGWFFVFVTVSYFSVPYYLLNYGETHVSSGLTALLFSTMPVFILLFSVAFLREKIYLSQIIGIATGFASLYMILKTQGLQLSHSNNLGVLAILSAAVLHALCYVITKKNGTTISVITYNALPIGIAGLLLFSIGHWVEHPVLSAITLRSWYALTYLGLFASVGGFIVYFFLLKRLSPVILSFIFIIFPVFAVLIGAWYEGQSISKDLALYSTVLLGGFAITKLPVEKLLTKKAQQPLVRTT